MYQFAIIGGAALLAAFFDVRSRRIPNALTFPLILCGIAHAALTGEAGGVWTAIQSAVLLSLPCLVLFLFAGGGAGDVKLLGALGAWLSVDQALQLLVAVAISGVVCGFAMAAIKGRVGIVLRNLWQIVCAMLFALSARRVKDAQNMMPDQAQMQTMPFGVPIFLGVCLAVLGRWIWL